MKRQRLAWERFDKEQEEKRRREQLEQERQQELQRKRQRLERERIEQEQEAKFAEYERWLREHPWLVLWQRCKWLFRGLICGLLLAALTYLLFGKFGNLEINFNRDDVKLAFFLVMVALLSLAAGSVKFFVAAFSHRPPAEAYEQWTNQPKPWRPSDLGVREVRRK